MLVIICSCVEGPSAILPYSWKGMRGHRLRPSWRNRNRYITTPRDEIFPLNVKYLIRNGPWIFCESWYVWSKFVQIHVIKWRRPLFVSFSPIISDGIRQIEAEPPQFRPLCTETGFIITLFRPPLYTHLFCENYVRQRSPFVSSRS